MYNHEIECTLLWIHLTKGVFTYEEFIGYEAKLINKCFWMLQSRSQSMNGNKNQRHDGRISWKKNQFQATLHNASKLSTFHSVKNKVLINKIARFLLVAQNVMYRPSNFWRRVSFFGDMKTHIISPNRWFLIRVITQSNLLWVEEKKFSHSAAPLMYPTQSPKIVCSPEVTFSWVIWHWILFWRPWIELV